MATVNERIDFDTAQIMVQELGLDVELERKWLQRKRRPAPAPPLPTKPPPGHQ